MTIRLNKRLADLGLYSRREADEWSGLAPAGRLDIDSTGLLALTQDGRVAKALVGERSTVWRCGPPRSSGSIPSSGASC